MASTSDGFDLWESLNRARERAGFALLRLAGWLAPVSALGDDLRARATPASPYQLGRLAELSHVITMVDMAGSRAAAALDLAAQPLPIPDPEVEERRLRCRQMHFGRVKAMLDLEEELKRREVEVRATLVVVAWR